MNEGVLEMIDRNVVKIKEEMKSLAKLRIESAIDTEVYSEEVDRLQNELDDFREQRLDIEHKSVKKEAFIRRADEIIEVINSREELLEQFDTDIFNALVEKIEVISLTHFVFVLKSGMRVEHAIYESHGSQRG